jgi:hypothetical protein
MLLRVIGQLLFQFGDAGFELFALLAVFVHFHFRKHALHVIRQVAGGFFPLRLSPPW